MHTCSLWACKQNSCGSFLLQIDCQILQDHFHFLLHSLIFHCFWARVRAHYISLFGAYVLLSTSQESQLFIKVIIQSFLETWIFFTNPVTHMVSELQSMHARYYNMHTWSLCACEHISGGSILLHIDCQILLEHFHFLSHCSIFHCFLARVRAH